MTEIDKILNGREERDSIKNKLSATGCNLISLSLNIPGIPKSNQNLSAFFHLVKEQLKNWLLANRIFIDQSKEIVLNNAAGDYYIVPLQLNDYDAKWLKQITEEFEITHSLGRFIDVDILNNNGKDVGSGKSKKCFFCKKFPAIECRREQRHTIEELQQYQKKKIKAYLKKIRLNEISRKISSIAIRSILYEISLTPKPGLVDMNGNGIHKDMNYKTFIDSTSIISTYFKKLIKEGFNCKTKNLEKALPKIRQIGLQMENGMFGLTDGVNTQKGLIFLMGLSLFTSGYIFRKNDSFQSKTFRDTIQKICRNMIQTELTGHSGEQKSHGEKCFDQFRVAGIRFEAENGFPTVFNHALPVLEKENSINNRAMTLNLLSIMSQLDDTNILYRSNNEILQTFKSKCKMVFENYSFDKYKEIMDFCAKEKISPGGAADLLSISVFIYLLLKNFP